MYKAPPLPKGKLPRLPRPRVANHMSPIVGQTQGAPGPPPPYGALWVCTLRQASVQAQQNKILISGTIGAFQSRRRGAAMCGSCPKYWVAVELTVVIATENTVSVDTVLTFI